jgi:hypothetical protein
MATLRDSEVEAVAQTLREVTATVATGEICTKASVGAAREAAFEERTSASERSRSPEPAQVEEEVAEEELQTASRMVMLREGLVPSAAPPFDPAACWNLLQKIKLALMKVSPTKEHLAELQHPDLLLETGVMEWDKPSLAVCCAGKAQCTAESTVIWPTGVLCFDKVAEVIITSSGETEERRRIEVGDRLMFKGEDFGYLAAITMTVRREVFFHVYEVKSGKMQVHGVMHSRRKQDSIQRRK